MPPRERYTPAPEGTKDVGFLELPRKSEGEKTKEVLVVRRGDGTLWLDWRTLRRKDMRS